MTKAEVVRTLNKRTGCGVPEAIRIYNELSCNGFYEIEKAELNKWIKENY